MNVKPDITNLQHIKELVDSFYAKVQGDDLLKDIFNTRVKGNWTPHLEKMYRFWQTALLGEHSYHGNPFVPHIGLQVNAQHFDRWVHLFEETTDTLFSGPVAEEAKWRAGRMAFIFKSRLLPASGSSQQIPQ